MTRNDFLNYLASKAYLFSLAVATIAYFIAIRLFQDSLTYSIPSYLDPYPGYPLLPEPYEIPLYLAGYVVIPAVALIFYFIFQKVVSVIASPDGGVTLRSRLDAQNEISTSATPRNDKLIFIGIGVSVAAFLSAILFFRPQLFSFVADYFQRRSVWHLLWLLFTKRVYIVQIAFAGAIVAFLFAYWKSSNSFIVALRQAHDDKVERWKGWKRLIPILGIVLAIIIFHPNFPAQDGFANYIVGPAFEATQGRPLVYETFSLYGILNTYLVAFLFKLGLPATFKSLTLVIMAGYSAFFWLLYKFLKTWFNSRLFAVIGTWAAVVLGFFLLSDPYVTAYEFIGQTAYRQGFFIVPALFIALHNKNVIARQVRAAKQSSNQTSKHENSNIGRSPRYARDDKKGWIFRELALLSSAIGLFWNTETGVYMTITTFVVFAYQELIQFQNTAFSRLKNAIVLGVKQLLHIALVLVVISAGNYLAFREFPHWTQQLRLMSMFESGYGKLPLPAIGLFELHVFVYLGFLTWIVSGLLIPKVGARRDAPLPLVFLAAYGPFALLYYVGNSAWSYLNFVSIPMVLLVLYGFRQYFRVGTQDFVPLQKRLVNAGFTAFLTFFLILTLAKIPVVFAGRDYSDISLISPEPKFTALFEDAQALKRLTSEKAIPVLHEDDGRLLLWADKVNYFHLTVGGERLTSVYDDAQIVYQHQVRDFVEQLELGKPRYVIVANKPDARFEDFLSQMKGSYTIETRLKTLNIYKRAL